MELFIDWRSLQCDKLVSPLYMEWYTQLVTIDGFIKHAKDFLKQIINI